MDGLARTQGPHTPNTRTRVWWKTRARRDPAYKYQGQSDSSSTLLQRTIYWQPVPGTDDRFLFVSKEGFVTISDGHARQYDRAPDNLIDEWTDDVTGEMVTWIWKNGKRERFRYKRSKRP